MIYGVVAPGAEAVLSHGEADLFTRLLKVWTEKRPRNLLRSTYFEGKQPFRDFGISIPPQIVNRFENVLGWPAKGVNALTDRSVFEGFVSPSGTDDPFGVDKLVFDNDLRVELPQAQKSSAIHACSFLTVTAGDVQSGEPEALIMARAADVSAAIWDRRRRDMEGFLSIVDTDENGVPSVLVMYTREAVLTLTRSAGGRWTVERREHGLGRVTVAPLAFQPELGRPFGHSRITRAAMGITDAALRTLVRAEASAEFYSAPQYWVLGGESSAFAGKDKWSAVMSRIKVLELNDADEKPSVQRFAGETPQPHIDMMRLWASAFAGDQGLALDSLGITQDNPSSAEAIYAAKEDLIVLTGHANRSWGRGAADAARLAVMIRDGLTEVPEELRDMTAQYTDPALTSPTAKADAFSKLASAIPGFSETEVGLEMAGLTREQIIRFQAEQRTSAVSSLVEQIAARADGAADVPSDEVNPDVQEAETLKAKFDALGVAVRAGATFQSAAKMLGLAGIVDSGAVPVTLRMPEADAAGLEDK